MNPAPMQLNIISVGPVTPFQSGVNELGLTDPDLLARNVDLANILALIAAYYLMDQDKYRARAFVNASNQIAQYNTAILSGAQARSQIRGIGDSIEAVIDEFLNNEGRVQRLIDLENKFRDRKNTIDLFRSIHGVGPVSAVKFYNQGYRTLEDLYYKANITNAQKIGILWNEHFKLRIPYEEMNIINDAVGKILNPYGINWAIAGSFRRKEPDSGDVDILIESRPDLNMEGIIYLLDGLLPKDTKLAQGEKLYLGVIRLSDKYNGHRLDIKFIDPRSYVYALMHFTGSQRFNILMRQRAIQYGLTLNEYGLFDKNNNSFPATTEEDIFRSLRVQYIPPEARSKNIINLTFL